jgi:hypothetical protein
MTSAWQLSNAMGTSLCFSVNDVRQVCGGIVADPVVSLTSLGGEFYSIATTGKTLEERGFEIWGVGEPGNAPGPNWLRLGRVVLFDAKRPKLGHFPIYKGF